MKLTAANANSKVVGVDELPGRSNYFTEGDPKMWRTSVPHFAKVCYEQIYPGIDLIYYGSQRQLEYDFVVAPGADPDAIVLAIETGNSKLGTQKPKIALDASGDLVITTESGDLRFHQPRVYQTAAQHEPRTTGDRQYVDARYNLREGVPKSESENSSYEVAFQLGPYDKTRPLVIDPTLSYSTFVGGSTVDQGLGIALDSSGNAYVTGSTDSIDFPTSVGAYETGADSGVCTGGPCSGDVFVTKLDATGSAIVFSTYLGGTSFDAGKSVDVDSSGNVYVTGETDSSNFPTANAFQGTADPGGSCTLGPCAGDAFVAELDSTGANLLYSSYLGGQFHDHGNGIAVLSSNAVYVTGVTRSGNFAVSTNAFQSTCPTCGTTSSAFVTKLDLTAAGAAQLLYSSFLGEGSSDGGNGIALDSAGNAYIVGTTASTSFPTTTNCYQASNAGGSEAFLAKFDPGAASGPASLLYSTLLGGSNNEQGLGIAVDAAGKI